MKEGGFNTIMNSDVKIVCNIRSCGRNHGGKKFSDDG